MRAPWSTLALLTLVSGCDRDTRVDRGHEDPFLPGRGSVDVLWVVRSAESMIGPQEVLGASVGAFLDGLEATDTDYRIGVVASSFDDDDPDRVSLLGDPPVLTFDDDPRTELARRLQVGAEAVSEIDPLVAAERALSPFATPDGSHHDFLRPGAGLAVVTASDDGDDDYRTPDEFEPTADRIGALQSLKAAPHMVIVSAFAVLPPEGGRSPALAAMLTGGLVCDLHADDLRPCMDDLGTASARMGSGRASRPIAR